MRCRDLQVPGTRNHPSGQCGGPNFFLVGYGSGKWRQPAPFGWPEAQKTRWPSQVISQVPLASRAPFTQMTIVPPNHVHTGEAELHGLLGMGQCGSQAGTGGSPCR
jgi:hypothetical protein